MPVDPDAVLDGNVCVDEFGNATVLKKGEEPPLSTVRRYVSHFATCTAPEQFRKRG
jgi:hypothetical protein